MEHPGGAAFEPQQRIGTKIFPFSQNSFTFPQENFHRESHSLKCHNTGKQTENTWRKISQPDPAGCFCKAQVLPCKFTGEERVVKNSPWVQYSWDAGALCLCQLTAISSIETYPLRTRALLICALPAVTAIFITLLCQFWILHIVLTSSSTRSCKQTAAFRAPLSGRLLQTTEGRSVY